MIRYSCQNIINPSYDFYRSDDRLWIIHEGIRKLNFVVETEAMKYVILKSVITVYFHNTMFKLCTLFYLDNLNILEYTSI